MSRAPDQDLLEILLDSWDRNNAIMLNLLRALPGGGLETKAIESSPSVAELFTHIHYHMLWHEGYHHGQIKLALKVAGHPISDEEAGPVTWDVWMCKK